MTRINLVPVEELADQHLFAEFREMKMVPKSLARSLRAMEARGHADPVAALLARIPRTFCLNTGHVSFFYDKGLFLQQRYSLLRRELWRRGVQYNEASLLDPDGVFALDPRLAQDYTPGPSDIAVSRARIDERVAQKPQWYRYTTPNKERQSHEPV